jgi:hypothetical protein
MEVEDALVCSLCGTPSPSISNLMSHLRLVHQSDCGVSLTCPVSDCNAIYTKVNSLYSHVYRKHKEQLSVRATVGNTTLTASPEAVPIIDFSLPEDLTYDTVVQGFI